MFVSTTANFFYGKPGFVSCREQKNLLLYPQTIIKDKLISMQNIQNRLANKELHLIIANSESLNFLIHRAMPLHKTSFFANIYRYLFYLIFSLMLLMLQKIEPACLVLKITYILYVVQQKTTSKLDKS